MKQLVDAIEGVDQQFLDRAESAPPARLALGDFENQALGVVESQVREVNQTIERGSRSLWQFVSEALDRAVTDGLLPRS